MLLSFLKLVLSDNAHSTMRGLFQTYNLSHYTPYVRVSSLVGIEGFEPSISWSQTRRIKPDFPTFRITGAPGWNRTTTLALQERTSTIKDTRA